MKIVKEIEFEALTEKEAFDKVRQRLGADGVILSVQTVKTPSFLPFFRKKKLIVRAGIIEEDKSPSGNVLDKELERRQIEIFRALLELKRESSAKKESKRHLTLEELAKSVEDEVEVTSLRASPRVGKTQDIKEKENDVISEVKGPKPADGHAAKGQKKVWLEELLEGEVPSDVVSFVSGDERNISLTRWLEKEGAGLFARDGERDLLAALGGRRVMVVGPTGVGKTTTIAKIAAWAVQEGIPVVLLSSDNYRVAAVEQIRTFARVLNVPLEIVNTGSELVPILGKYSEDTLMLMDTAGHGFRESDRLSHIRGVFDYFKPHRVHIAISSTMKFKDVKLAVERIRETITLDKVILTKIDEAALPSSLLWVPKCFGLPLSFVTTGQNVPRDIHLASKDFVSSYLSMEVSGSGGR